GRASAAPSFRGVAVRLVAMAVRPYGTWPAPLSAAAVARVAGRSFGGVWPEADRVRWLEYRADEGGRGVVVSDGVDVTPTGVNVRTRVHEYGGGGRWGWGGAVYHLGFLHAR